MKAKDTFVCEKKKNLTPWFVSSRNIASARGLRLPGRLALADPGSLLVYVLKKTFCNSTIFSYPCVVNKVSVGQLYCFILLPVQFVEVEICHENVSVQ